METIRIIFISIAIFILLWIFYLIYKRLTIKYSKYSFNSNGDLIEDSNGVIDYEFYKFL